MAARMCTRSLAFKGVAVADADDKAEEGGCEHLRRGICAGIFDIQTAFSAFHASCALVFL